MTAQQSGTSYPYWRQNINSSTKHQEHFTLYPLATTWPTLDRNDRDQSLGLITLLVSHTGQKSSICHQQLAAKLPHLRWSTWCQVPRLSENISLVSTQELSHVKAQHISVLTPDSTLFASFRNTRTQSSMWWICHLCFKFIPVHCPFLSFQGFPFVHTLHPMTRGPKL